MQCSSIEKMAKSNFCGDIWYHKQDEQCESRLGLYIFMEGSKNNDRSHRSHKYICVINRGYLCTVLLIFASIQWILDDGLAIERGRRNTPIDALIKICMGQRLFHSSTGGKCDYQELCVLRNNGYPQYVVVISRCYLLAHGELRCPAPKSTTPGIGWTAS